MRQQFYNKQGNFYCDMCAVPRGMFKAISVSDKRAYGCNKCKRYINNPIEPETKILLKSYLLNGQYNGAFASTIAEFLFPEVKVKRCDHPGCIVIASPNNMHISDDEIYCGGHFVRCGTCLQKFPMKKTYVCCGNYRCQPCHKNHKVANHQNIELQLDDAAYPNTIPIRNGVALGYNPPYEIDDIS